MAAAGCSWLRPCILQYYVSLKDLSGTGLFTTLAPNPYFSSPLSLRILTFLYYSHLESLLFFTTLAPRPVSQAPSHAQASASRPAPQVPIICGLALPGLSSKCQLYAGSRSHAFLTSGAHVWARAPRPFSQAPIMCRLALPGLSPNGPVGPKGFF